MSNGHDAPVEVRELEKLIREFSYSNGLEVKTVFTDLLRYIVYGFSLPNTPPPTDWRYTQEQNMVFYKMFAAWIRIMNTQIRIHGHYDAFGDLFMALTSLQSQQQNGLFFTSNDVPELCREILMGQKKNVNTICDFAVGSGRMLIANKVTNPRSYLVGWDIDYICCLMCVCNFLMNGCVGEVMCIDTLRLDNFRGAWLVNESYYRTGRPSIHWMNEQEVIRHHHAKIPPYVYFLDQERHDEYFKMREMWMKFMSLFPDEKKDSGDESA